MTDAAELEAEDLVDAGLVERVNERRALSRDDLDLRDELVALVDAEAVIDVGGSRDERAASQGEAERGERRSPRGA